MFGLVLCHSRTIVNSGLGDLIRFLWSLTPFSGTISWSTIWCLITQAVQKLKIIGWKLILICPKRPCGLPQPFLTRPPVLLTILAVVFLQFLHYFVWRSCRWVSDSSILVPLVTSGSVWTILPVPFRKSTDIWLEERLPSISERLLSAASHSHPAGLRGHRQTWIPRWNRWIWNWGWRAREIRPAGSVSWYPSVLSLRSVPLGGDGSSGMLLCQALNQYTLSPAVSFNTVLHISTHLPQ